MKKINQMFLLMLNFNNQICGNKICIKWNIDEQQLYILDLRDHNWKFGRQRALFRTDIDKSYVNKLFEVILHKVLSFRFN